MTAPNASSASLDDRRTGVIVGMVFATVLALCFVLPLDFALNYFMNDLVTAADHVRFLVVAAIAALGISAIHTGWVTCVTHLPLGRCAVGCFLVTVTVFLLVGAGYAAFSMSSFLDYAIGNEWSNTLCRVLASAQAVTASVAFAYGGRALSLH